MPDWDWVWSIKMGVPLGVFVGFFATPILLMLGFFEREKFTGPRLEKEDVVGFSKEKMIS